jgi:Ca2+-binding RTX toxin-like protein
MARARSSCTASAAPTTTAPSVVAFADGTFVVGYRASPNAQAQRYDSAGFEQGGPIELGTSADDGGGMAGIQLDRLPEGGFVATMRRWLSDGNEMTLFARRFDRTGSASALVPVAVRRNEFIDDAAIGADDNGNAILAYATSPFGGGPHPVFFRRLVSDFAFVDSSTQTLRVAGAETDDTIEVKLEGGNVVVTGGAAPKAFAAADVTSIAIAGGGGNDSIVNRTVLPATLEGGAGDDTIRGGGGKDRIFGNDGRDSLFGGGGNDRLAGGTGGDWLYGQSGSDQLFGEGGNDRLFGDDASGIDTLSGGAGDDLLVSRDALVDHLFGDRGRDTAMADNDDVLAGIESTR